MNPSGSKTKNTANYTASRSGMINSGNTSQVYKLDASYFNKIPLFDSLSRGELNLLAKHISCVKVKKHHIIAKEGDKGDFVCFIADGKVDVIKGDQKGNEVVINTLMKGRSIGEMSLIDNTPRSASLRTQTECVLLKLTKKSFDMILSQYPEMGIKILKGLARLLSMNLRKTSGRLADYLD